MRMFTIYHNKLGSAQTFKVYSPVVKRLSRPLSGREMNVGPDIRGIVLENPEPEQKHRKSLFSTIEGQARSSIFTHVSQVSLRPK